MISNLFHIIKLSVQRKDRELYFLFYNVLGFLPKDISYYKLALIHTSAMMKNERGEHIDNERLEYLGDAILDAAIADILFKKYPDKREGFLTSTRAKIVQREHLNALALSLGIDKIVKQGHQSATHNNYIYGNAIEALIGAIYLDRGYRYVKDFIRNKIIDKDLSEFVRQERNHKSRLIEWAQKQKVPFEYTLLDVKTDESNNPMFRSSVSLAGVYAGEGRGYTKKESHQLASKRAMRKIKYDKKFRETVLQYAKNLQERESAEKQAAETAPEKYEEKVQQNVTAENFAATAAVENTAEIQQPETAAAVTESATPVQLAAEETKNETPEEKQA